MDSEGNDQKSGQVHIYTRRNSNKEDCFAECNKYLNATGCEFRPDKGKCSYHTMDVVSSNGNATWYCWYKPGEKKP